MNDATPWQSEGIALHHLDQGRHIDVHTIETCWDGRPLTPNFTDSCLAVLAMAGQRES